MIITCPRCSTKYSVDAAVIGPAGRSVRCSNCSYTWLQSGPPARTPRNRADAAAGPSADDAGVRTAGDTALDTTDATRPLERPAAPADDASLEERRWAAEHGDAAADDDAPADGRFDRDQEQKRAEDLIGPAEPVDEGDGRGAEEPDDAAPEPIPSVLASPPSSPGFSTAGYGSRRPSRPVFIAALALAALVVVVGLLILARGPIVAALPSTAGIYGALGFDVDTLGAGLHIVDVASEREATETGETLVVTGVVANVEDEERSVPLIRVVLLDSDDDALQSLIVTPARRILSAGARLDFAARLDNPSPQARRIMVTFAPREDAG